MWILFCLIPSCNFFPGLAGIYKAVTESFRNFWGISKADWIALVGKYLYQFWDLQILGPDWWTISLRAGFIGGQRGHAPQW